MWKLMALVLVGWLLWMGFQGENTIEDPETTFVNETKKFDPELSPLWEAEDWAGLAAAYGAREQRRKLTATELLGRAQVLFELGQYTAALRATESSMGGGITVSKHRHLKARCLLKLAKADQAQGWAELWLKKNPDDPEAHFYLGVALLDLRQFNDGLRHLHKAVELDSNEGERAHRLLADTYMHQGIAARKNGDYHNAARLMENAVGLDPENGPFNAALGRVYVGLKRWPEALDALDLAHDHGVKGRDALTGLRDDLCTTHHELAAVALIEERLEDGLAHARAGQQWVTNKTARKRLDGLEETIRTKLVARLKAEARVLDGEEARVHWRKILILEPSDAEALWEDSRGLDPKRRREIEALVLQSEWGFQARLRLAERAEQEGRVAEVLSLLCEAWLIAKGEEKLQLEEKLFDKIVGWDLEPPQSEWQVIWRWRSHEDNSLVWEKMIPEIERVFPDRWYLLAYRAEYHRNRGELLKSQDLLDQTRTLDPPVRAEKRLQTLQGD